MSTTFNLTNTASEVNTAIQAVVGADTAPTNGSVNMVTSDGVFDYVGTQLGALAGKTITTESVGIAATDNDTSIPTCAAVKDALIGTIHCNVADGSTGVTGTLPLTVNSDPNGHASASGGVITLAAGTYLVNFTGIFSENDSNTYDYHTVKFEYDGADVLRSTHSIVPLNSNKTPQGGDLASQMFVMSRFSFPNVINEVADKLLASTVVCTSGSPIELKITNVEQSPHSTLNYKNVAIVAFKI